MGNEFDRTGMQLGLRSYGTGPMSAPFYLAHDKSCSCAVCAQERMLNTQAREEIRREMREEIIALIEKEPVLPKSPFEELGVRRALVVFLRIIFAPWRSQRVCTIGAKKKLIQRIRHKYEKQGTS